MGFLFAFAFFVVEVGFVIATFDWEEEVAAEDLRLTVVLGLLGLPGVIYWMFCVHRLHKILAEMTQWSISKYTLPRRPSSTSFPFITCTGSSNGPVNFPTI